MKTRFLAGAILAFTMGCGGEERQNICEQAEDILATEMNRICSTASCCACDCWAEGPWPVFKETDEVCWCDDRSDLESREWLFIDPECKWVGDVEWAEVCVNGDDERCFSKLNTEGC